MKRLMTLAVAAITASAFGAGPYKETVDGIEWTYTVSDGKATVGSHDGSMSAAPESTTGHVDIPSALGGFPVTGIGNHAFYGCRVSTVTIPPCVVSIGAYAFYSCDLTSVTIPSSVTEFGEDAFYSCDKLSSVTIQSSVIGAYAFYSCDGLTSVTIPSCVTEFGESAFYSCDKLSSVTIQSSVIGAYAFYSCSGLTTVTMEEGVAHIGQGAFFSCPGLKSVTIPSSVTSIGEYAFAYCDAMKTVYVAKGDTNRVKKLLKASGFDTSKVAFVEGAEPTPTPTPEPGPTPEPTPESETAFEAAHTFNGLVTDADGAMCGMVQVATAKKTKKGAVKVSGFVMLADGKKQTLKAATGTVSGGAVSVTTKAGKAGELALTVTDEGFTGTFGGMKVASGTVGENTGILSGTLKMSYFDAKTGKVKTKSIKIGGLTDGGAAVGTATAKEQPEKAFEAKLAE